MTLAPLPILYSFRRCPYAIRARLALHASGLPYELREVHLRNKPAAMLAASPKGTVPVLVVPGSQVIDESWDIMLWALRQNDPENWLGQDDRSLHEARQLLALNDGAFKAALDRYKYADRFPEHAQSHYRGQCEPFLHELEARLQDHACLTGRNPSIADVAIVPFVRQFAGVEPEWFGEAPYPRLRDWLDRWIESRLFAEVMGKHPPWISGQPPVLIPAHDT